eukprot:CAMPEP_0181131074 /NCGR_PEP_ID=MMETSP1071-20121207/30222_1 /TAXON_ID=35127 /ORGANISM="Thalassiosira sp., Strain NH16" /LENGTH=139 /DNA_ID=CAMNT_0023217225 /DNA_START=153 /DNA_END=569 /DNA_ORIENTATION=+
MARSCEQLVTSNKDVSFTVHDHRLDESPVQEDPDTCSPPMISLHIVHSPRAGIACALNHGLDYCRADLIVRMDADDISEPQRLLSQISFMHANPSIAAVGTSTVLFSTTQTTNGKQDNRCSDIILPYSDQTQKFTTSVL